MAFKTLKILFSILYSRLMYVNVDSGMALCTDGLLVSMSRSSSSLGRFKPVTLNPHKLACYVAYACFSSLEVIGTVSSTHFAYSRCAESVWVTGYAARRITLHDDGYYDYDLTMTWCSCKSTG